LPRTLRPPSPRGTPARRGAVRGTPVRTEDGLMAGARREGKAAGHKAGSSDASHESMRIQRAIARAGAASRRAAEAMIADGRVTVNDQPATIGQVVTPAHDRIRVDGVLLRPPGNRPDTWLLLNKPGGY